MHSATEERFQPSKHRPCSGVKLLPATGIWTSGYTNRPRHTTLWTRQSSQGISTAPPGRLSRQWGKCMASWHSGEEDSARKHKTWHPRSGGHNWWQCPAQILHTSGCTQFWPKDCQIRIHPFLASGWVIDAKTVNMLMICVRDATWRVPLTTRYICRTWQGWWWCMCTQFSCQPNSNRTNSDLQPLVDRNCMCGSIIIYPNHNHVSMRSKLGLCSPVNIQTVHSNIDMFPTAPNCPSVAVAGLPFKFHPHPPVNMDPIKLPLPYDLMMIVARLRLAHCGNPKWPTPKNRIKTIKTWNCKDRSQNSGGQCAGMIQGRQHPILRPAGKLRPGSESASRDCEPCIRGRERAEF